MGLVLFVCLITKNTQLSMKGNFMVEDWNPIDFKMAQSWFMTDVDWQPIQSTYYSLINGFYSVVGAKFSE